MIAKRFFFEHSPSPENFAEVFLKKLTSFYSRRHINRFAHLISIKRIKMESIFDGIEKGAPIEVFALNKAFLDDTDANKVNLGVGGKFISLITSYL